MKFYATYNKIEPWNPIYVKIFWNEDTLNNFISINKYVTYKVLDVSVINKEVQESYFKNCKFIEEDNIDCI